jgi:hypothetical protein
MEVGLIEIWLRSAASGMGRACIDYFRLNLAR